jgi:DNA repair protein RadC
MEKQKNMSNLGEIEVSYRYDNALADRPIIKSAEDAIDVLKNLYHLERIGLQEQFVIVFLNRANKVIGSSNLFVGGLTGTVVDIKLVLAIGLKLMASSIIISHNHPSGNIKPSEEDKKITNKLCDASKLLEIQLLDHLVVTPDMKYFSFANEGLLKN